MTPARPSEAAKTRSGAVGIDGRFLLGVLVKAALLFAALNLLFALLYPMDALGRISFYNILFPGRERLPFGENQAQAYNLSMYNLEAMFASQRLNAAPKAADEYRVLVIGDSSVWGTLLRPQDTLSGQLNAAGLSCGARTLRTFNLGYPTLSVTKDLMLLQEAVQRYQPDRILWLVTLEGLPRELQLASPLLANNAARAQNLIRTYNLSLDPADPALVHPSFWDQTLVGARRPLADLVRLQLYGELWGATGIDQTYPEKYDAAQRDFTADVSFHGRPGPTLDAASLSLDALSAGVKLAGSVPVTFVNEPILISAGKNSDLRYDFYYPRWAYDQYRQDMAGLAQANAWDYLDLWNLVDQKEFTNSAIHLTPAGEKLLTERVGQALESACR
ncbi:MAG TPA: hypothetical protein VF518_13665 [Polyangia bacterium]